jgi:hypothetical protein
VLLRFREIAAIEFLQSSMSKKKPIVSDAAEHLQRSTLNRTAAAWAEFPPQSMDTAEGPPPRMRQTDWPKPFDLFHHTK